MAEQEVATVKEEKSETLTGAITKAVAEQDKSGIKIPNSTITQEQDPGDEQTEETEEEEKEERTAEEIAEEEEETNNGRILIRALKDPTKSAAVIDFLAMQAGYTKQNINTKQDVKEAKASIEDILAQHLGEEFKFLAPKLAPAITESLNSLLSQDSNKDLRARIEKQELRELQKETQETHEKLSQEWFGSNDMPTNVAKAMSVAMDEFPPTDPNMSPDRYYRRIFSMVAGELGISKKRGSGNQGSDRVTRNRDDSVARDLTSTNNKGVSPNINGGNPKRLSLKDSVTLALEQVKQSSSRK